jgi:hypothetical protein
VITVVPRGVVARRHYGAGAIGLALWLYGVGRAAGDVRRVVGGAGDGELRWRALTRWIGAIERGSLFMCVRGSPVGWTRRQRAERAAATLASFALVEGDATRLVFDGAARAA